jgi:hypothetical protein
MKKLNLIIALLLSTITIAQKDSVLIQKYLDDIENTTYYFSTYELIVSNDEKTGATLDVHINPDFTFSMITSKLVNLGLCTENVTLIIVFENGDKVTVESWNKFNCDGDAYFYLNKSDIDKLSTLAISKIRITNGYTYESVTATVDNPRYFIQIFWAIKNKQSIKYKE